MRKIHIALFQSEVMQLKFETIENRKFRVSFVPVRVISGRNYPPITPKALKSTKFTMA